MAIDTLDKQYQVSEKFPPDKEVTWGYPAEEDGWFHAHNSIRDELRTVKEALQAMQQRAEPLKEWEIKALQTVCAGHVEHIHMHHSNETDLFVPELKTRFLYPDKLVTDHEGLEKLLTTISGIIGNLKVSDTIDALLKEWTSYEEYMLPHLKEEEEIGLPLMRAYFTPKEIAVLVQKIFKRASSFEGGSFIHTMGVEKFRNEFMVQEHIPFFVWYIDFSAKHKLFLREFVRNVEALKEGKEPVAGGSKCSIM